MATIPLSEGVIAILCATEEASAAIGDLKPVVQVADIRQVNSQNTNNTTERFRLLLSDGIHMIQGMLGTQQNHLVKNGRLLKGSILQLFQFVCNNIQGRKIVIIVELEVLQETCPIIGEPKQYMAPGALAPPSAVQAEVKSAYVQHGNPHAAGPRPGPTYLGSEAGRLQQPKQESGPQMQSYARPSPVNHDPGRYAQNNGPPSAVSGNAVGGGAYTNISRAPSSSSYMRPQQPMYQQQPSMYMNRGPIAKNGAPPRIVPIAALNPYQGGWTIKARVTSKSDLRHYNNARGDGKVFSFDLLDADGGEIRVTCFNAAVDQFHDVIEAGKVYLISKGSLKPAQKNFNHLPNDHEISLEATSMVLPCDEDDSKIPQLQFHFRPISDIEGMENNSVLDVIGVVSFISPTATIMRKNGTEAQKRSLQLRDMSNKSVEFTMWGNFCNAEGQTLQNLCDSGNFPVLAVKAARVSEFNGKALGTISSSQLLIEPDNPEARELKLWFDREGRNTPCHSISRETSFAKTDVRKTISQIKDEKLGTSEKPDWITVCATLSFMKMDNFYYTACPLQVGDRQCNRKVLNNGDGKWRCERCDQSVDECDYRYILQFQIQDHTGVTWVTAFQECGEELLGMSAKELFALKYDQQDDMAFQETVRSALFRKYNFKLKVKEEIFNDEARVKSTVVKADKLNFASESKSLHEMMQKLKTGDSGTSLVGTTPAPATSSTIRETGGFNSNSNQYGNHSNQFGNHSNQYNGGGYSGVNNSSMYASSCTSCGGSGHTSANCPSIISATPRQPLGGNTGGSSNLQCFKCQRVGHFARDCPGLPVSLSSVPPAYGPNSNVIPGRYSSVQRQNVGGF